METENRPVLPGAGGGGMGGQRLVGTEVQFEKMKGSGGVGGGGFTTL